MRLTYRIVARHEVVYNAVAVYCQSCGSKLGGDENFCPRCGAGLRTGTSVGREKVYGTFLFRIEKDGSLDPLATLTVTNTKITVAYENTVLDKPLHQISAVRVTRHGGFLGLGFWCNHTLWIKGVGRFVSDNYEDLTKAANLITSLASG